MIVLQNDNQTATYKYFFFYCLHDFIVNSKHWSSRLKDSGSKLSFIFQKSYYNNNLFESIFKINYYFGSWLIRKYWNQMYGNVKKNLFIYSGTDFINTYE